MGVNAIPNVKTGLKRGLRCLPVPATAEYTEIHAVLIHAFFDRHTHAAPVARLTRQHNVYSRAYLSQDGVEESVEMFSKAAQSVADTAEQPLRHVIVTGVLLSHLRQHRPQLNAHKCMLPSVGYPMPGTCKKVGCTGVGLYFAPSFVSFYPYLSPFPTPPQFRRPGSCC